MADRIALLVELITREVCQRSDPRNRSVWIDDIATSGGTVIALGEQGIDSLCQRRHARGQE